MTDASDVLPSRIAAESKFQWMTRVGFLARGLLYVLIGFLALSTGRTEDLTGALEYLGRGSGRMMLWVIAAGMTAYGLWRLADGAFGIENGGGTSKALRARAAAAFIGCIYLYVAYKAARILFAGSAGAQSPQQQADTVLDLPGGELVLGIAALVLVIAGANQLRKAAQCKFLNRLDEGAGSQPWIKWFGRIGYAARGIIFITVGYLIGRAAVDGRSNEAGGLEQALDFFSGPVLYAVSFGLILFGAFSMVEARYRRIHRPPNAGQIADKMAGNG
jgi:hypothetical protein